MYWAYTTMTTVGYGDISSITIAEKVGLPGAHSSLSRTQSLGHD